MAPRIAVESNQILERRMSFRRSAVIARTTVRELINRTNELTEVKGISNISSGPKSSGPIRSL